MKGRLVTAYLIFMVANGAGATDLATLEHTIRQLTPQPARCSHTPEPFFSCRYETPAEHSLVFELASGKDGPSASLTHNFDNRQGRDLITIMRTYFSTVGINPTDFDECVWQSLVTSQGMMLEDVELVCRRVGFGDSVTLEVFALP